MLQSPAIFARFVGVFFVCLFVEANLWFSVYSFSDIFLWEPGVAVLKSGAMLDLWGTLPVHPGSIFLYGSAFLSFLGMSQTYAMQVFMTFSVTSIITLISYTCYSLRPNSLWWLVVVVILAPSVALLDMTPPSTLAALLSALYVLLVLKISEAKFASNSLLAGAGICAAVLLTSRIDAIVLIALSLPYLWMICNKRTWILLTFTVLYFCALDPFLWVNPVDHFASILKQAYVNHLEPLGFRYKWHILILPTISVLLGFAYAFVRPRATSLRRDFLFWLLLASAVICGALLFSSYHPARYFFPLIVIWETFLPLLVLELVRSFPSYASRAPFSREFAVFLWLFLDRAPSAIFIVVQNLVRNGLHL